MDKNNKKKGKGPVKKSADKPKKDPAKDNKPVAGYKPAKPSNDLVYEKDKTTEETQTKVAGKHKTNDKKTYREKILNQDRRITNKERDYPDIE